MQNVIQESLEMSRSACKHINNLKLCIIKYNTKKKLISSDIPIINYNNFYFRSTGYDNAGIIIFFPISSEMLIVIYDSTMYTGNDNKKMIISNNEYEVKYLNYYQILNSNGLIFYKDSEMTKELITSLNNNKIKKYLKYYYTYFATNINVTLLLIIHIILLFLFFLNLQQAITML